MNPAKGSKQQSKSSKLTVELLTWTGDLWKSTFIPTLTHAIFISKEPFVDFKITSLEFLKICQDVLDGVYPHVKHQLSPGDDIFVVISLSSDSFTKLSTHTTSQACERMTVRKSKLATFIMDKVTAFFKGKLYKNHPERIKQYVQWALMPDGPAFYKYPTPQDFVGDRNGPDYIVR